jgi:hypothetical protein
LIFTCFINSCFCWGFFLKSFFFWLGFFISSCFFLF